ncbi:MAG: 50S ribosomal protein L15 [Defluviitaleaceae bacterium]|nr:50S ribosomal protein L15 [Defluviitaleaceae bacterium]
MRLGELKPAEGSKFKTFRVGRGHGSGAGKTAGRGHKGQGARAGKRRAYPTHEGGQFPLFRRIPKRGFKNRNAKDIVHINIHNLDVFEAGSVVDILALQSKGLVSNPRDGVKILGNGELGKKLTVKVNYFSASAKEKIEAAGGRAEVV